MIFQELPTPHELGDRPELASLAMLDTAIEIATYALAAAQPVLPFLDEHPVPLPADLVLADAIVQQAATLQALVACYCRLTAPAPPGRPTLASASAPPNF